MTKSPSPSPPPFCVAPATYFREYDCRGSMVPEGQARPYLRAIVRRILSIRCMKWGMVSDNSFSRLLNVSKASLGYVPRLLSPSVAKVGKTLRLHS